MKYIAKKIIDIKYKFEELEITEKDFKNIISIKNGDKYRFVELENGSLLNIDFIYSIEQEI